MGKRPGHHPVSQAGIEELMVEAALAGKNVVRLKGGDPYVFGRGGEEVAACVKAGVPVRVISGVTSAISVPAAAGIPVTHREVSHMFTVVSGHAPLTEKEHTHLAGLGGTIVVLMGIGTLHQLAAGLRRAGMRADMPMAVVERGYRPGQRTTIAELGTITTAAADCSNPAVLVIGDVVRVAEANRGLRGGRSRPRPPGRVPDGGVRTVSALNAIAPALPGTAPGHAGTTAGTMPEAAELPLEGFRIGVTSHRRSQDLIEALERRGAEVLHAPALKIAPVQEDVSLIEDTRAIIAARPDLCIATTAYGMRRWCEAADTFGIGEQLLETLGATRMFVRGPKARGAVRAAGLADVGISSDETTATLVDMLLAEGVRGKTVAVQLHGYTDVRQLERLRMSGATVLTVTPYRWVKPDGADRLPRLIEAACSGNLDVLTFTSAPAVDAMWSTAHEMGLYKQLVESLKTTVATAVVGPVTAQPLSMPGCSRWSRTGSGWAP